MSISDRPKTSLHVLGPALSISEPLSPGYRGYDSGSIIPRDQEELVMLTVVVRCPFNAKLAYWQNEEKLSLARSILRAVKSWSH